jgi:hypothetical protein
MLILLWLVLFLVVVSFLLLIPAAWRRAIIERYAGGRPVACPENHQPAVVNIDVSHAASTMIDGSPELRLADCSRWPEKEACGQECLAEAVRAESYKEAPRPGRKQIYHLPVLLAAFAAWYVGAIWHSGFLFRAQWMHALGLTYAQVKQIGWWASPHLLTSAICLLFAYDVAWLLALSHRKGVLQGVLMAALLSAALAAASWFAIARLPHQLFAIEAGYAVLATLTIGAIEGGMWDKMVLRS